ncbi:MAG TPA: hypothetical protein VF894_00005, partial [Anaeromyxobacter sp.]
NQGEYRAELTGGMAALSHAVAGARPSVTYNTNLVVRPPSSGDVTTFQSELVVDSALATGTAFSRGNIDLLYQPLANRLQGPSTPWAPDLSASNFYQARLRTQVGGGSTGGDGAIAARFDDVRVGVDGGSASLFDDFTAGTTFDSSKWAIGGENVQLASGAVQMSLEQSDRPTSLPLNLADTSASALQADVTVLQHSATGAGRVAAQLRRSLYNDGSNGSGSAPDTNAANSMVGDLLATISMTGTDVSCAVVRCETAQCGTVSFVQPFTSLGPVTLGTTHTLYLNWDAAHHQVQFQLDGHPTVAVDPVLAGHAISSGPRVPIQRIALAADSAGTGQLFTTGSAGAITATFDNMKTN